MKKISTINFKGRIIPIEDSAYQQLLDYLDSLRAYFQSEEGRDEIMNDIEDRIAELCEMEIKNGTPAITDEIVQRIINSMGKVDDFKEMEQEEKENTGGKSNQLNPPPASQFYRNSRDKLVGGVCSGLAHLLKIDPTVVRVLFALLSFGGGTGILIYIILWIVLPEKSLEPVTQKRLFRNPDEKVIAGVAGGIASYFNIAVWIPRIIFLLPIVIGSLSSFFDHILIVSGGFGGTLFLTYIILWIVLPVAKTATEKMQMRGQKIDVSSIRSAVQGEMETWNDRLQNADKKIESGVERMSNEIQETTKRVQEQSGPKVKTIAGRILHILLTLIKIFFFIIGFILCASVSIAFVSIALGGIVAYPISDFILSGNTQVYAYWGTILFFFITPAVALIIWFVRKVAGIRSKRNYLGIAFGIFWSIGWVSLFYLISSLVYDFSKTAKENKSVIVATTGDSILHLSTLQKPIVYSGEYTWLKLDDAPFNITDDSLAYPGVSLKIKPATTANYEAAFTRISRGKTIKEAKTRSGRIPFNISASGNTLYLDHSIAIGKNDLFRAQEVEVLVQIPVGKKISFDSTLTSKLHGLKLSEEFENGRDDERWHTEEIFDYEPGIIYIMTNEGLKKENEFIPTPGIREPENKNPSGNENDTIQKTEKRITQHKSENIMPDFPANPWIF
jgi:phage shock protein PspC (stress-responsive transcriptional regulator)